MSISNEVGRIQADRNTIRAKLIELGLATSVDNLTKLAAAIESIMNHGSISATVKEGNTYTIPAGYHDGSGTVTGLSDTEGDAETYKLQSKTVVPTKKQQTVTPDEGNYGLSDVKVSPIPDIYQDVSSVTAKKEEVLTGKIIVTATGEIITGEMANNGAVSKVLDATVISYTIPKGYHNGNGVITITLESKTVTPTKETQEIMPEAGKVLDKVIVGPIPDNYVDSSDANVTASQMLEGSSGYAKGVKVDGAMKNNGDVTTTIDGITTESVNIPEGYTLGGTVSLTKDIEEALAAI